jgi:hypothetical protein
VAYNKFITRDGEVLLDLTDATVTKETLKLNTIAYDKRGNRIIGEFTGDEQGTNINLQEKSVTENGEVVADEGYDGHSKVIVNIPRPKLQEKTVIPTTQEQNITADPDKDGLSSVVVRAIQTEEKIITTNGDFTPSEGKFLSRVTVAIQPPLQEKTITSNGVVTPDPDYYGLSSVNVDVAIPEGYIIPTGTLDISSNGKVDVRSYEYVSVAGPETKIDYYDGSFEVS